MQDNLYVPGDENVVILDTWHDHAGQAYSQGHTVEAGRASMVRAAADRPGAESHAGRLLQEAANRLRHRGLRASG